jgi:peptidoglycan hydrolase CwlO-like protein
MIRNSLMALIAILILSCSFFAYSFLGTRSTMMSSQNLELKDELTKLKEKQASLQTEKSTLDKQYEDIQQKLAKINK